MTAQEMRNLTRALFDATAWIAVARLNYIYEFRHTYRLGAEVESLRDGHHIGAPWAGLSNIYTQPPQKKVRMVLDR